MDTPPGPVAAVLQPPRPGAAVAPPPLTPPPAHPSADATAEAADSETPPPDGRSIADLLADAGDLSVPGNRRRAVEAIRQIEQARRAAAEQRARDIGLPLRVEGPDGRIMELAGFDGDRPLYFITHNANAAISTGSNLLRVSPYFATGEGGTIGIWDGGAVRTTHQELAGRVTVMDGASVADHATHVGGTLIASGVSNNARGMAVSARLDSYDWNSDTSEMTGRGAAYPGEPGTIQISNHSYGYAAGWTQTGLASPQWEWWGEGTTTAGLEDDFGMYNTYARDSDATAASLPYYLIVRSAGNDRADNPAAGASVRLTPSTGAVVSYDAALHPAGDNVYRGGYDTLSFDTMAKNILAVGSVSDAVTSGARDPAKAVVSSFSCWGPTDDGRIKPDLVANGATLYSSVGSGDAAYATYSGTSMASPNAAGTAQQIVHLHGRLFPGHALRASTLKALLIHTADDRGTAGPDYQYGWGLMNGKAAADLLQVYRNAAGTRRVVEDRLTPTRTTYTQSFTWDGISPIRVTLVWTDPAGTATGTGDLRTSRLVNNLNLHLTGPSGSLHLPWVMPFTAGFDTNQFAAAAVTGTNNIDNVEQVYLAAPPAPGVYQINVGYTGTLSGNAQPFSLIVSGGATNDVAPAPVLSAVNPAAGTRAPLTLTLTGNRFLHGAAVKLTRTGQPDAPGTGIEMLGDILRVRFDASTLESGVWNVQVTNPDGQSALLPNAFTLTTPLWSEDFETGASGWTHAAADGTDYWVMSTTKSVSPTHAYFTSGPNQKSDTHLDSPAIGIPANATSLRLAFWHDFNFRSGSDGAVLELSVNGGAWVDVTASGSGASFAAGGYNASITDANNPLYGRAAWSGSSSGFTQVLVDLTDTNKYAGANVQMRWRMGTNNKLSSTGWYVDDVSLIGAVAANQPPAIATPAAASPNPAGGLTTDLSVTATDDGGDAALTYTWTVNDEFTHPVQFSVNGSAAARTTTATFQKAGFYLFTVTVRDGAGLTTSSQVEVEVAQTLTSITVTPAAVSVDTGRTQAFTATARDQFGEALVSQPAAFDWSVGGGGTMDADGVFTAGDTPGGPYTVTAASGAVSGTAEVTVTVPPTPYALWIAGYDLEGADTEPAADPDGDGLSNQVEMWFDFDPTDPDSTLWLDGPAFAGTEVSLVINKVITNGVFRILSGARPGGTWDHETVIPVDTNATNQPVTLPASGNPSFYRLQYTPPAE